MGVGKNPRGSYIFDILPAATVKGYPVIDGVVKTRMESALPDSSTHLVTTGYLL